MNILEIAFKCNANAHYPVGKPAIYTFTSEALEKFVDQIIASHELSKRNSESMNIKTLRLISYIAFAGLTPWFILWCDGWNFTLGTSAYVTATVSLWFTVMALYFVFIVEAKNDTKK